MSIRSICIALVSVLCLRAQEAPTAREKELLRLIETLQDRVEKLEQRFDSTRSASAASPAAPAPQPTAPETTVFAPAPALATTPPAPAISPAGNVFAGTTFGLMLDGYYEYNFNDPIGRVNLLRAYDVASNSFSLNQATFVIDHEADVATGNRFGIRVDLQYGQATEILQGNPAQEPRPQAYRPLWQAYGTYVFPLGSGLTVDFGKWAGSLGIEGNYTKDQINYSRGYLFNFLPYYHFGSRTTYNFNDHVSLTWWLVNGIGQSEDFNNFKSNAFIWTIKPVKTVTWNVNYYEGQEGRDVAPDLNPGFAAVATQPGLSVTPVSPVPNGRTNIFDSYATWNVTAKLLLAGEGDYVISRVFSNSAPAHVSICAAYSRYQLFPKFVIAGRAEYFSDRGGLFSGVTQALKETTGTLEYKFVEGFLVRGEWRRDFSNRAFFLTDTPNVLSKEQNTAALGMVWWFGNKQGAW